MSTPPTIPGFKLPPDSVQCPNCNGAGQVFAMIHGRKARGGSFHSSGMRSCSLCSGDGFITVEHMRRIEEGRKLRANRIARGLSLREEAIRLGIDMRVLADREHGRDSTNRPDFLRSDT